MKKIKLVVTTLFFVTVLNTTVLAGQWKENASGWWYQNDDGNYSRNQWQEIDGRQYYFGEDGYMLFNTMTPDGKMVGADGALIENSEATIVYDNSSYQSILDYYTIRIKSATPVLIDEYKAEAANNTNGLNGLAQISTNKVSELAGISTEGVGEMANLYFDSGSGKYSEYEEWAGKLYDVYMEEADKIYDVYMNSAL